MNPQPSRQPAGGAHLDHYSPLAALLQKPHVPSPVARVTPPAPKKRKWKMIWLETETFTETDVCAICGDKYCGHPERTITRQKHVTRTRKRQYIDD